MMGLVPQPDFMIIQSYHFIRLVSYRFPLRLDYFAFDAFDILPRLLKCASLPSTLVTVYVVLEDWIC